MPLGGTGRRSNARGLLAGRRATAYPAAVAVTCTACGAALVEGALRCRFCGENAREAPATSGAAGSVSLADIAPDAYRVAELMEELATIAPPVFEWWRTADRPMKTRAFEILQELRDLLRRAANPRR